MAISTVDTTGKVPIKIWATDIEAEALQQLQKLSQLPFLYKHVAVMPDVHAGKGSTIGTVIATRNTIIPAAVGVDIGCGMAAAKLPVRREQISSELESRIRSSIERVVPVGREGNYNIDEDTLQWNGWKRALSISYPLLNAQKQLGSLGGGNHFIELCADTEGGVWVVLHSGSRNIGKVIAEKHIENAKGLMRKYYIGLPDPDLAYLAMDTTEFTNYINDMSWAQDYAMQNREVMMQRILREISHYMNGGQTLVPDITINCHHNYTEMEHHFGENVWITRKGAVRARRSDYGIIPGSMGTRSYIVRGLGNEQSFNSCSHGAGRRMSRTAARARYTTEDLERETAGVNCRKDAGIVDEIPSAYKDIDRVMERQADLVEIVAELKQFICIKG